MHRDTSGAIPLFLGALFLCLWTGEGGKDNIVFVQVMVMSIIVVLGVQIPVLGWIPLLGGCTWLAIILVNMMVVVAPAA